VDPTTGYSDAGQFLRSMQWLNHNNPDWQRTITGSQTPFGPLTGEGILAARNLSSVHLDVTAPPGVVNRWWSSNNIGKYAVVSPIQAGYVKQPMVFINHLQSVVNVDDQNFDGLYYNIQPGVQISGSVSRWENPIDPYSNTPQVFWYCQDTTIDGLQLLEPGASPFSLYGPEVLP
jgi:hypothetical protein